MEEYENELDLWWSSLTTAEKERIASKASKTGEEEVPYPACTELWLSLPVYEKQWIREHCTKKHGVVIPEWTEGESMSY